jgi:gas vesicle protein
LENPKGRSIENMVDRRHEQDVNEAAARFAETLAESYRIVYEQAADAQQRQARLAQDFSERVMDHLREQAESGRAASERLTDQARRQQEAGQAFAQESAKAYMDFLDTAFSQYREGTQRAAGSAREGARTLSDTTAGLLGTATGAAGATAGAAADATRDTANIAAGRPPFSDYDEMNVEEITEQLDSLSEAELRRTRNYEQGNKNRQTLIAEMDRRLEASS